MLLESKETEPRLGNHPSWLVLIATCCLKLSFSQLASLSSRSPWCWETRIMRPPAVQVELVAGDVTSSLCNRRERLMCLLSGQRFTRIHLNRRINRGLHSNQQLSPYRDLHRTHTGSGNVFSLITFWPTACNKAVLTQAVGSSWLTKSLMYFLTSISGFEIVTWPPTQTHFNHYTL